MHAEEHYALRALRAGASGYVNKEGAAEELAGAVRKVLMGGTHVSARLAETLAKSLSTGSSRPAHERLSDRELEVMRGLAAGKTVKEISAGLALSEKTVSTYRTRLLEKMQMHSNAELIQYALREGLVDSCPCRACRTPADRRIGQLPAVARRPTWDATGMATSSGRPTRILLVDDHPAVSQRIGELLAGTIPDAEMVSAVSGEEGLSLAWTQPFDLVLLDLRLPGRSGIEILKELRAIKPLLPVIIVSSLPDSPYATLARRAGAIDFVTKSALVQDLGRAVKSALGGRATT